MSHITTAVIPIGGLGTRFYPLTKTLRKYLLPVYNRPLLDYLLDNCIEAGLTRIIFVTARGDAQIQHYLNEDPALKQTLCSRGKEATYVQFIAPLHTRVESIIIEQPTDTACGPAAALLYAKDYIPEGESFVVTMGDDFLWRSDNGSDLADMVTAYTESGAAAACMLEPVKSFADLQRNGAAILKKRDKSSFRYLQGIKEKPSADVHPRLASIGRYIFDASVFDVISQQQPDPRNGELHFSDTLDLLCKNSLVLAHIMRGKQLDCGTPKNWLSSNNFIARTRV